VGYKARLRPVRTAWLSRRIWRRRLILLVGAIVIGCAATAFAKLADLAGDLYRHIQATWFYAPLVITPMGFALSQVATKLWFEGAQGSGIPQVIAARATPHLEHRAALLGARVTIGKIVLVIFGLAIGASIGREGPTVQVGAAIMFAVGGMAGIGRQRGLVLAGAAAGIAAAFNTPLAGILFAIEELAKAFEPRMTAITTGAVVLAGITSVALVGDYTYFGTATLAVTNAADWAAVPVCAGIGGALGGLFSRVSIRLITRPPRLAAHRRTTRAIFAALCGLVVAIMALLTDGYAAGTGYGETQRLLETGVSLPFWYAPAKLVSTLLSASSGIPGGLFSPSLSVGAGLGALVTGALPWIDPRTIATLMMVGYFAGVVQSPLTAFVIVAEMTASAHASLPLLATALLAAGLSRLISREPLYHALSRGYREPPPPRKPITLPWSDPVA
jgi:H+/Cl- antiporter ClcA